VNFQAAIAARIENVELVWHLNDVNTPKFLQTLCLPFVRAWASKIAISSRGVAEYYFPDPAAVESRLFLLYPPVDTKNFAPARDRSIEKEVRREFGIDDDCPIIGTVANFDPTKRFECILEAAPDIRKKFPKAKFLFVGQRLENRRAYWDLLVRRTAELGLVDDVIFTGERRDIARLMRAMTVYAHPSESESCGMSILEASASGLPVVAADSIGPRETVLQDLTGILVEANQPAQFANAVIRMLSDPEAARRMGAAGARRMHSLFSLENCVHEHMRLYFGLAHDESAFVAKSGISSSTAVEQFEDASARR
jgi:glycosyltransferase involved in cell wall biosynthesis